GGRWVGGGGGAGLGGRGRTGCGRSASGAALFLFDRPLALDAVAGERQGLEPLLGDGLAAALAVAEAALGDLLERGDHFLQQPPVAVAQLEEELAIVGGAGLVAEVLGRSVLRPLAVHDVLPHFLDELAVLLLELLAEVSEPFLSHHRLLRRTSPPAPLDAQAITAPR